MSATSAPVARLAYTVKEAAQAIGLGERKMADLVRAGLIKTVPVGRRILVPLFAIEEFLKENAS